MKILFVTPRVPHPRVIGGHVIVSQRIRRLAARGHQVGLVSFSGNGDDEGGEALRPFLIEMETVPVTSGPSRFRPGAPPGPFRGVHSEEMRRRVGDMVERGRYEIALAEFSSMGQYLWGNPYLPAVRRVVSVHQCYTIIRRKAMQLRRPLRCSLCEQWRVARLQRYETRVYRAADRVLVLTGEERYGLLGFAPDLKVHVIPSGVDVDYFRPAPEDRREQAIVFTGYFAEPTNRDAVFWFCHRVWPALRESHPDMTFYVVGADPSDAMRDLQRRDPQIVVTGEVDDIRPYLARAKAFVCPIRMGSGLRVKLLEAMAAGVPVVSTSLGGEGIPIQMGENGFLADRPELMAQYVELLLNDQRLRSAVSRNARAMIKERFSWNRGMDVLETVLRETVAKG